MLKNCLPDSLPKLEHPLLPNLNPIFAFVISFRSRSRSPRGRTGGWSPMSDRKRHVGDRVS